MSVDPFDQLYRPTSPAVPDDAFTDQLRLRLLGLLDGDDEGDDVGAQPPERDSVMVLDVESPARQRSRRRIALVSVAAAIAVVAVGISVVASRGNSDRVGVLDGSSTTRPSQEPAASASSDLAGSSTTGAENVEDRTDDELPEIQDLSGLGGTSQPMPSGGRVSAGAGEVAVGEWVNNSVTIVDPTTGAMLGKVVPGGIDIDLLTTPDAVWAAFTGTGIPPGPGDVYKIDSASGAVVGHVTIPSGLWWGRGAADGTGVWYLTVGTQTNLVHIDAASVTVDRQFVVPQGTTAVGLSSSSLWIADKSNLRCLDPTTGTECGTVALGDFAEVWDIQTSGNEVWLYGYDQSQRPLVARVDSTSSAVTGTVTVGQTTDLAEHFNFTIAGEALWVHTSEADVVKLDRATLQVEARYGSEPGAGSVAFDDGILWVSAPSEGLLHRIPLP